MPGGKRNLIRYRHVINLETKMKIIRKHEEGQGITSIARELRYAPSTINTIVKDAHRIREYAKRTAMAKSTIITKVRKGAISDMEKLLLVWLEDQIQKQLPLSKQLIQAKARSLYEDTKAKYPQETQSFSASQGWFSRFKNRVGFPKVMIDDETEISDVKAINDYLEIAKQYSEWFKNIIDEGSYLKEQIFSLHETRLFYHKTPSKTYIAKEEKKTSEPIESKKRVTLLLGVNASGTFKLKPLLVHTSANPCALKGITKATLPVHFRSNDKAHITIQVFEDWFVNSFSPEVEKFCHENKIPFKILLILENSPNHPSNLDDISSDIRVVYLPTGTAYLLHPMNQGITSNFKACYIRRMLTQIVNTLDSNCNLTFLEFWKEYNVYEAIKNIAAAWAEVSENCIKDAWRKLTPHLALNFRRFIDNDEILEQVVAKIVKLARKLQLDVNQDDVKELINASDEDLTKEELAELAAAKSSDNEQHGTDEIETQPKRFTVEGLAAAVQSLNKLYEDLEKQDPDVSRFLQFQRVVDDAFSNYRKVYEEKKRTSVQTSFDTFILKQKQCVESKIGLGEPSSTATTASASALSECDTIEDLTRTESPLCNIKMEENDAEDPLSIVQYLS